MLQLLTENAKLNLKDIQDSTPLQVIVRFIEPEEFQLYNCHQIESGIFDNLHSQKINNFKT